MVHRGRAAPRRVTDGGRHARSLQGTARRGQRDRGFWRHRQVARSPASGSRMIPDTKLDAAALGLPGRNGHRHQPDRASAREPLARVIGDELLADELLDAVAGTAAVAGVSSPDRSRPHRSAARGPRRRPRASLRTRARAPSGAALRCQYGARPVEVDVHPQVEVASRRRSPRRPGGRWRRHLRARPRHPPRSPGHGAQPAGLRPRRAAAPRGRRAQARRPARAWHPPIVTGLASSRLASRVPMNPATAGDNDPGAHAASSLPSPGHGFASRYTLPAGGAAAIVR